MIFFMHKHVSVHYEGEGEAMTISSEVIHISDMSGWMFAPSIRAILVKPQPG